MKTMEENEDWFNNAPEYEVPVYKHNEEPVDKKSPSINLIKFNNVTFEKNSLVINYKITVDEWKKLGQLLKQIDGSVQFWIGDWIRFGEKKGFTGKYISTETYNELVEITGIDRKTLQNYKSISDKTSEVRKNMENLPLEGKVSFTHFKELAPLTPEKQQVYVDKVIKDNLSVSKLKNLIKEDVREEQAKGGELININNNMMDVRLGDFSIVLDDIPDNSLDLILTDPPYPKQYLHCWNELGEFAQKKLKDGGFLIAYSGHIYLPDVLNRVMESGLNWYWLGSCYHEGRIAQCFEVNMFARHKPILFLQKGNKVKQSIWCEDVFVSKKKEKSNHEWEQNVEIFDKLIKTFNPKIVCDPFLGGGTTAIACLMNDVKFIGAEIDEKSYLISKKRIDSYGHER